MAARQGDAVSQAELEGPEFPWEVEYLWEDFLELHSGRALPTESGIAGLTWLDMDAWARRTDHDTYAPHEFRALMVIDRVFCAELRTQK